MNEINRDDILSGYACLRPQMACRIYVTKPWFYTIRRIFRWIKYWTVGDNRGLLTRWEDSQRFKILEDIDKAMKRG